MTRALFALMVVVAAAACGGPEQFTLQITWSNGPIQECPMAGVDDKSCANIPLTCDAVARLRIVDAEDGQVLYTSCFDVPATGDLCGLRDIALPANIVLPNRMVRIQLLVWSKDKLAEGGLAGGQCPLVAPFTLFGFPQTDGGVSTLTPAVGREIYFPVGDREIAQLELGCSDVGQLDTEVCRTRSLRLDVGLKVPPSFRDGSDLVDQVSLRFGAPVVDRDGAVLPLGATVPLTPVQVGGTWSWTATVAGPFESLRCVRAQLDAPVLATATCRIPAQLPSGDVPFEAYIFEKTLIAQIERALGAPLPDAGALIGFVVDRANQPIANATVAGVAAGFEPATILYPDDTYTGLRSGGTNSDGVFVSTDAPISTVWHATAPGLRSTPGYGGGLRKSVTAVVLVMDPIDRVTP